MGFYDKWNTRWRDYFNSQRIKTLYDYDQKQVALMNEARIVDVYGVAEIHIYYCLITFECGENTFVFEGVFRRNERESQWHENQLIDRHFFKYLMDGFPLDRLLEEWVELKKVSPEGGF